MSKRKVLSLHPKEVLTDKKLAQRVSTILIWDLEPALVDVIKTENESYPQSCECKLCTTIDRSNGEGGEFVSAPTAMANPLSEEFRDHLDEHIAAALRVLYESPKPRNSTSIPEGFFDVKAGG